VLQISLSSDTLNEQQLYDYGYYTLRQRLAPVRGVTFPTPAGGKYRQIMVDLALVRCPGLPNPIASGRRRRLEQTAGNRSAFRPVRRRQVGAYRGGR
jgi:hypothetical protein